MTVRGGGSVSSEGALLVGPGVVVADAGSSPSATLPTQLPAVPAVSTLSVAEQPVVKRPRQRGSPLSPLVMQRW